MTQATRAAAPDLSEATLQARLQRFLSQAAAEAVELSEFRRCSSGFSWMTFSLRASRLSAPPRELILQVGPPSGLLAPYAARPQAQALRALAGSDMRVAELVAWSDDETHLGAPFFVCSKVAGDAVVPWSMDTLTADERRSLAEQMVDMLGALHRADAPVHALADLFPAVTAANAALTEVEAWIARVEHWRTRAYPILRWAAHWLRRHAPAAPRVCIAHGDYRLGNFLQQGGHITAMLDWEMVHLGHPHEDLGWMLLPMYNKGARRLLDAMTRDEALARYSARSGIAIELDELHYFECLAMYKSIGITLAGLHAYARRGFDDMRMVSMGTQVAAMSRQLDRMIGERP